MKKRVMFAVLTIVIGFGFLMFAFAGNGSGLTGKVLGIWHFQASSWSGKIEENFLEISETSIVWDSGQRNTYDTALTEKDGMVVARIAGTEREIFVIKIIDQDTIETTFPVYGKQMLKRVTAEARDEVLKKGK